MIQNYLENKTRQNKICISIKSIGIILIIMQFYQNIFLI